MSDGLGRIELAVFVLAALLWLGGTGSAAGAQDLSTPTASATSTRSVYLECRELDSANFSLHEDIPVVYQSTLFRKEPDFGRRKVVRGTLKFGDSSDQFVAFIVDLAQGKLYLDLNRNQDLTDDPGGVYSCQPRFSFSSSIGFNNVRLTFKTLMGHHPALLDLWFFDFGKTNQPSVSVNRRYLWEGKLAFEGQDWQVGLIDSLQGRIGAANGAALLLRPWSAWNQAHPAQAGPLDLLGFSRDLFFAGQTFHVDCAFIQQDNQPKYRLDFKPQPAELGQLRLTGKFIQRLVLTRDSSQPLTVILDAPEPVVMIPVGSYTNGDVSLKHGETEASRLSDRFGLPPISPCAPTIKAGGEAVLNAGGPLTNTVLVKRRGNSLVLDYRLLGAGGEVYEARGPHTDPGFAVYRAGKKIYCGKFEPG
ncbi:MAG: hypothetical protein ABSF95_19290 [Verrucomicrobiota bacterium]|jgi:hypothetical protein